MVPQCALCNLLQAFGRLGGDYKSISTGLSIFARRDRALACAAPELPMHMEYDFSQTDDPGGGERMAEAVGTAEREAAPHPGLRKAARALNCDRITAEVVTAMDAAGIPNVVLKGPSIARWLYPSGGRTYGDTDLLVPASEFGRAETLLRSLGFVGTVEDFHPFEKGMGSLRVERDFVRPPRHPLGPAGAVDLHHNLPRFCCSDEVLWDALVAGHVESMTVGGAVVRVLSRTAVALHVVTHAVQHGYSFHTEQDLERVVPALTPEEWRVVAELAARLGADDLLGAGLRHRPPGAAVADHLGLPHPVPSDMRFWRESAPDGAVAFREFWAAPSLSAKLGWIRWMLVPSPARLRFISSLKHLDDLPLWRSYLRRWARIVTHLPAAVRFVAARSQVPTEELDASK